MAPRGVALRAMPAAKPPKLSVTVIGGGALGSFLAARLARHGIAVSLVARGARLERVCSEGILLAADGAADRISVPARQSCENFPPPDIAILAVKAGDLGSALDLLEPVIRPGMGIVTVQNGVEAPDIAAARWPQAEVLAARVHGFFEMHGDAVRHVGVEPSVAFGPLDGKRAASADAFASCLTAASIAFTRPDDMRHALWEKFLLASAIGGVGLALGKPAGQLCSDGQARIMLEGAMEEIALVAAAKGVTLASDCVKQTMAFAASFPPGATSSLQRDMEAGRASEFDSLTGAVIRLADALDMEVPVHRAILRQIEARGLI